MKQAYEAPEVQVLEMEVQAMLAQSATIDTTYSEEDM